LTTRRETYCFSSERGRVSTATEAERLALTGADALSRPRERRLEPLVAERLQQIVEGSYLERFEGIDVVGGDEDRDRPPAGLYFVEQLEAANPGHLDVEEQEVRRLAPHGLERFRRSRELSRDLDVGLPDEKLQKAPARRWLVVDDEGADLIHAPARES
jgi:hypothetical protein